VTATADALLEAIGTPDVEMPAAIRMALEAPPLLDAVEYAERHIVLPHGTNARSGPFSVAAAPYTREWLQAMSDRSVRQVTLITSTQVGKSTALLLRLCWGVACDPSPMLWVGPRGQDVAYMIRRRLEPILRGSPDLARHMSGVRSDERKDEISLLNGSIIYTGTGRSAASLRSKPIKVAIGDEVSDWPALPKKHEGAHGVRLMRERLRTWGNEAQLIIATTPTIEHEVAWQEFLSSDRRRFWVPCPRCGAWQQLAESQLRWPKDATHETLELSTVLYVCAACGDPILDREKLPMMQRGKWVPEAVHIDTATGLVDEHAPNPHRGYQIGALYSPWITWGEYVRELLHAHADVTLMQAFTNLWRGLPHKPVIETLTPAQASTRVLKTLPRGHAHRAAQVLTCGVDVQKDYMVWVVRAWGYDWQSWLVDQGTSQTWGDLMRDVVLRAWPQHVTGKQMHVTRAGVDMADGHRTDEVYSLAREYAHVVTPMRGDHKRLVPVQMRSLSTSKVEGGVGMQFALWSNPLFFRRLRKGMSTDPGHRGAWWICSDPEGRYLRELGNVQCEITTDRKGQPIERWVTTGPDHYWDAEAMAWVAAELAGVAHLVDIGMAGAPDAKQSVHPDEQAEPDAPAVQADQMRKAKPEPWSRRGRGGGGWNIRPGRR
jgi:phage terminase large subunit GpA-like protein